MGYVDRMRAKYTAKWGVHLAGMNFQTRSNVDKEKKVMWQFAISSGLPHFYGKIGGYVVIYRCKDKNTTQGKLAELVGSPVAP